MSHMTLQSLAVSGPYNGHSKTFIEGGVVDVLIDVLEEHVGGGILYILLYEKGRRS